MKERKKGRKTERQKGRPSQSSKNILKIDCLLVCACVSECERERDASLYHRVLVLLHTTYVTIHVHTNFCGFLWSKRKKTAFLVSGYALLFSCHSFPDDVPSIQHEILGKTSRFFFSTDYTQSNILNTEHFRTVQFAYIQEQTMHMSWVFLLHSKYIPIHVHTYIFGCM